MKIRNGFVSNSSSSSFIINKDDLSEEQVEKIRNHIKVGQKLGIEFCEKSDAWRIEEKTNTICGFTIIDNFDMEEFLKKIDIPEDKIKWEDW